MLGIHASLAEVASMYVQLFAATQRDAAQQKASALEVWKTYSGEDFGKKIRNIPVPQRTEFLRVWDANAPDLCCICEAVAEVLRDGRMFCSTECITAGTELICARCGRAAHYNEEMPYCSACDGHNARGSPSRALASLLWTHEFRQGVSAYKRWAQ